MQGNNYGSFRQNKNVPENVRRKISDGLKLAWREGRIKPRLKMFTSEELREYKRMQSRARYVEHRQRILEEQRKWRANNPKRKKEISHRYWERNREKLNAKQRQRNKTPERKTFMRKYAPQHRADNSDLYGTYAHNRRARQLNAEGQYTDKQWVEKLAEFGGCCVYCGNRENICRDHDVPLVRGGSNNITNIVPACGSCNSAKGTLTGSEFRMRLVGEGFSMDTRWAKQLAEAQECGRQSRWALP